MIGPHVLDNPVVFFFQAEDGIRDVAVTGVQTCALPIFLRAATSLQSSTIVLGRSSRESTEEQARLIGEAWEKLGDSKPQFNLEIHMPNEIGRASCRERV